MAAINAVVGNFVARLSATAKQCRCMFGVATCEALQCLMMITMLNEKSHIFVTAHSCLSIP